jgi:hypothetical protein
MEMIKTTKRAMLQVSQYQTSNYTIQPIKKWHGTGTKTDMKTIGTE